MNTTEMKRILAKKLADEGCYFTYKDISLKKVQASPEWPIRDAYLVIIKDYEHIHFKIYLDEDDFFGKGVWLYRKEYDEDTKTYYEPSNIIGDEHSMTKNHDELLKDILVKLGYYIGTRF